MPALPVRLIAIAALVAIACGRDASAQPSTWQLPATPANGGALATQSTDGNALVARMLAGMERNVSLTAKVRQRIWLGDRETQGEGQYWHQSVDNQRRSRWQLRTLAGGETVSLVQVFDRRYVWTERRMGENRKVSRIDIDTLRREMLTRAETAGEAALGVSPQQATLLARGGISQLLADLQRRFDFGPPRPALVGEHLPRPDHRGGLDAVRGENRCGETVRAVVDDQREIRTATGLQSGGDAGGAESGGGGHGHRACSWSRLTGPHRPATGR